MKTGTAVALGLACLIVAPVAIGAYSVFSNVVTAPSRVINKTLDTNNIITSYEFFHDAHNQYKARVSQIQAHKQVAKDVVADRIEANRVRIELTAMQQSCRDLVSRYNANSDKVNKAIFRGQSAPETLDMNKCE